MSHRAAPIALCLLTVACSPPPERDLQRVPPYPSVAAHLVDPFIGTAGEGFTFPGAVAPWGMVSVSPHNDYTTPRDFVLEGRISPAGYSHGAGKLHGLGLTQLSGVGCPDLGAPTVMASVGELVTDAEARAASYSDEVAWPGYYALQLSGAHIRVEATASSRAGLLRLTFPARNGDANILVDAGTSLSWRDGDNEVRVVSPQEVQGRAEGGLFCMRPNRQAVYFVARIDQPALASGTWSDDTVGPEPHRRGRRVGAFFRLRTEAHRPVLLRVGISYVSVEGARRNLEAELEQVGFEQQRRQVFARWERQLSRIRVWGGSEAQRTMYYTALYHALLHPNLLSDVDGRYPTMGSGGLGHGGPGQSGAGSRYTVFSMWDTYRTLHPLLTLAYPEQQEQMIHSLTAMVHESGQPPKWELVSQEVNMMVGDPLLPVLADSFLKGIAPDAIAAVFPLLLQATRETGEGAHRPGNADYLKLGYIPMERADEVWGPVSTTLEYAFADWSLAQLARALGHHHDAAQLEQQAQAYRKLFDPQTALLRPRNADGSWSQPFDPDAMEGSAPQPRSGGPGYVEGTAHQYAFFVPHDVAGLVQLHGGEQAFTANLQQLFESGRYTLWNEPDMAYPYLFTYLPGQAWRSQREVRRAMQRFFDTTPAGLPGNDDAGTLSAWLVFSAMGLYPDCPASLRYSLAAPLFDRVELTLDPRYHGGRRLVIEARRSEPDAQYVQQLTVNGAAHPQPQLSHATLTAGATVQVELGPQPLTSP